LTCDYVSVRQRYGKTNISLPGHKPFLFVKKRGFISKRNVFSSIAFIYIKPGKLIRRAHTHTHTHTHTYVFIHSFIHYVVCYRVGP